MIHGFRIFSFSLAVALMLVARCSVGQAQTVEWSRQLGTTAADIGYGISSDSLGNIYVSGRTSGVLGGSSEGGQDAFVTKYDPSGTLQWTRQLGASGVINYTDVAFAVSADGLGNVYISGQTDGPLQGADPNAEDSFVTMYDSAGVHQWTRQFGTHAVDGSFGVSADGLGNVYVSGVTGGDLEGTSAGGDDAYLRKYDSTGSVVWTRQLGTTEEDRSNSVSADKMGNVYLSGFTKGDMDGTNEGNRDAFVTKYDSSGVFQWTRQFGTTALDESLGVSSDGVGNVYVSGRTGGSLAATHAGGADVFLAKFDSSGNPQWTRQIGDLNFDAALGVSADALGNIYISGDVEDGTLGESSFGDHDVFVSKYNSNGAHQWTHQYGTTEEDISRSVSTDGRGRVYVTGQTRGDLGGSLIGSRDAFVSKLVEPAITYTHLAGFLSSIDGEQLESFETQTATNTRDTTSISPSAFDVESTANMGVWGQPPADFEGTHATDGDNWLVAPLNGDVTFTLQPNTKSFGTFITDYGDDELGDLAALVNLADGESVLYTIANPGGDNANEVFWGLESVSSAISSVVFSIDGNVGFDQVYTSLAAAADFNLNGNVGGGDLAKWEGDFGLNGGSDADGDGDSDGMDFLIWQQIVTESTDADFDGDGDVDGFDFLDWQLGFGDIYDSGDLANWEASYGSVTTLSAGVSAVPEPAGALLALAGTAIALLRSRGRQALPIRRRSMQ